MPKRTIVFSLASTAAVLIATVLVLRHIAESDLPDEETVPLPPEERMPRIGGKWRSVGRAPSGLGGHNTLFAIDAVAVRSIA